MSCRNSHLYILSGQIIATSADVTANGGSVRESFQNPLNSGLGIIVICPDIVLQNVKRHSLLKNSWMHHYLSVDFLAQPGMRVKCDKPPTC